MQTLSAWSECPTQSILTRRHGVYVEMVPSRQKQQPQQSGPSFLSQLPQQDSPHHGDGDNQSEQTK